MNYNHFVDNRDEKYFKKNNLNIQEISYEGNWLT